MSETRVVIISGKGGVGKTTIASATAVAAAGRGYRTLAVSLDRAHNLGDVLQCALGSMPSPVPGFASLDAMEIDPQAELKANWPVLQAYFTRLFTYLGIGGAEAEEMAVLPGLEELLVLTRLAELAGHNQYDLIVADMAPTASSLRYLSFPDMMEGALGKLIALDQRIAAIMRPLQDRLFKLPIPENNVYDSLRDIAKKLGALRRLLADPARATVRLVMTPENIVLEETRRAFTYLSLFGFTVDSVIVNRLLPKEATQGYMRSWGEIQEKVVAQTRECFAGLPIHTIYYRPAEIIGIPQLRQTAAALYGEADPMLFHPTEPALSYEKEGDSTILIIHLPNVAGDSLDLRRRDHDLILTVDGWRRNILLPDSLVGHSVAKARLSGEYLRIAFE